MKGAHMALIPGRTPPAAATPAAAAGPAAANGTRTVMLQKPITTHEGTVNKLTFRPLTAALAIKYGKLPFTLKRGTAENGEDATFEVDYKAAATWIADLTGVDELVLGQMNMQDYLAACRALIEHTAGLGN